MRKMILAGLAAVLLAGTSFAYAANSSSTATSVPTDTGSVTQLADADAPPPPPPPPGPGDHDGRGGPGGPGHHGPRGDMPPPPPPSKAAHFRIERGSFQIDVKCADDDTTQACAAVAVQLIDKAAALPMDQPPPRPAQ